jgi:hypothetical protein
MLQQTQMIPLIPIFLTEEQAFDFKEYQENKEIFDLLKRYDALGLRNASCVLHFDMHGKVKSIEKHQFYHL